MVKEWRCYMNTLLISILVFILGLIIGVLGVIGFNNFKLKRDEKEALDIIEQAKKNAEKSKRESILEAKEEVQKVIWTEEI